MHEKQFIESLLKQQKIYQKIDRTLKKEQNDLKEAFHQKWDEIDSFLDNMGL